MVEILGGLELLVKLLLSITTAIENALYQAK
jgi:hypothetical protein